MERKPRVLVAMSGGVDSSVAAALLHEQGYDVVGMTMQVWDYSSCELEEGMGTCCSSKDVDDARAVADRLGFPFYVANCEAKFKAMVIDPFLSSYLEGSTPLPCVNCNTFLKFDHLYQRMLELDCDFLATGHYAQIERNAEGQARITTSADSWKDQTYFLFTLRPDILNRLMFPVGGMTKADVRFHAERLGLVTAKKKDSTGICFVGNRSYSEFIKEQVASDLLPGGKIRLYPTGEVLGLHAGIHNFTYGQRKGLGVAGRSLKSELSSPETEGPSTTGEPPLYVIRIDGAAREVWVGEEKYLYRQRLRLERSNWLGSFAPDETLRVKVRFQHVGAEARIVRGSGDGEYFVEFDRPQRAITPGQAAVVYRDRELLGGGWIAGERDWREPQPERTGSVGSV